MCAFFGTTVQTRCGAERVLGTLLGMLAVLVGCSGNVGGPSAAPRDGDAVSGAELPVGWSVSDDTPPSLLAHLAVVDEAGDRLIIFGASTGDTWSLPLSGRDANHWILLPSVLSIAADSAGALQNSAVYDPFGQRVLVLITSSVRSATALWQL